MAYTRRTHEDASPIRYRISFSTMCFESRYVSVIWISSLIVDYLMIRMNGPTDSAFCRMILSTTSSPTWKPQWWSRPLFCPGDGDTCGLHVPTLNSTGAVHSSCGLSVPLSFDKFVTNVLSYRNHDSPLQKVQASTTYYTDYSGDGTEDDDPSDPVLDSILDYAISHSVTHISLSFVYGDPVPQQLSACKTLKTLSLCGFYVHEESLRSLSLTALHLCGDAFSGYSIDPFNACPNLKNLSLQGCSLSRTKFLKISAPQLVELKIEGLIGAEASYIDIDAPNLRTFIYAHTPRLNFSSINFPNLEYADITYLRHKDEKKEDCLSLFGLFQWLHQAQFLVLDSGRHDSGVVDALSVVLNMLENQSSPFHRLKILKLNRSNISPKVMSYLCNSSPHAEIKLLELPKVEH